MAPGVLWTRKPVTSCPGESIGGWRTTAHPGREEARTAGGGLRAPERWRPNPQQTAGAAATRETPGTARAMVTARAQHPAPTGEGGRLLTPHPAPSPVPSEPGELPLLGPGLHVGCGEDQVEEEAAHVDSRHQEEDGRPGGLRGLRDESANKDVARPGVSPYPRRLKR